MEVKDNSEQDDKQKVNVEVPTLHSPTNIIKEEITEEKPTVPSLDITDFHRNEITLVQDIKTENEDFNDNLDLAEDSTIRDVDDSESVESTDDSILENPSSFNSNNDGIDVKEELDDFEEKFDVDNTSWML
eukprot:TRINITY_DN7424_c0_g1_i2.p1 TRINITY_DN7424_c0_g1~~TRINITY_DN7424_c0_g1_i2.p1  ORF type:complete len:131 (+),score=29.39 TRINITY_DN7424_c0_g1_i2:322-714(+)